MSKRFGRNQKRKLKADNAKWRKAHMQQVELAQRLRRHGQVNADAVRRTREVLGRHFATLPPEIMRLPGCVPTFTFRSADHIDSWPIWDGAAAQKLQYMLDTVETHWLTVKADTLAQHQLVYLDAPGGTMGYAVTKTALLGSEPRSLAQHIVKGFADMLEKRIIEIQKEHS